MTKDKESSQITFNQIMLKKPILDAKKLEENKENDIKSE